MVFDLQDLARQNFAAKEFASQASTSAELKEQTSTTTWGSFAADAFRSEEGELGSEKGEIIEMRLQQ